MTRRTVSATRVSSRSTPDVDDRTAQLGGLAHGLGYSKPAILDRADEPIARFLPLTSYVPTAAAVRDAVLAAAALDHATRSRMAMIGRENAERRFGSAAFKAGLSALSAFVSLERT